MGKRIVSKIVSIAILSSAFSSACNAAEAPTPRQLQASAQLHVAGDSIHDLPKSISTLELVVEHNLHSGVVIRIWRYATKYGEGGCDQGGQVGLDGKTCPRFGLMVSTRWEMEDDSKFALWTTDPRRWWRLPPGAKGTVGGFRESGGIGSVILYACEASTAVDTGEVDPSSVDNWHAVPYRLSVGPYNKVRLERLPDVGPPKNCWSDGKPPFLIDGGSHDR